MVLTSVDGINKYCSHCGAYLNYNTVVKCDWFNCPVITCSKYNCVYKEFSHYNYPKGVIGIAYCHNHYDLVKHNYKKDTDLAQLEKLGKSNLS